MKARPDISPSAKAVMAPRPELRRERPPSKVRSHRPRTSSSGGVLQPRLLFDIEPPTNILAIIAGDYFRSSRCMCSQLVGFTQAEPCRILDQ